eukprot:16430232-Heterocapsa_arctica.AAC.1
MHDHQAAVSPHMDENISKEGRNKQVVNVFWHYLRHPTTIPFASASRCRVQTRSPKLAADSGCPLATIPFAYAS